MKNLLLWSVFLSAAAWAMAAKADGGKVYYYSFDLTNGYWGTENLSADHCSKVVARFVSAHGLAGDCVDLRGEGSDSEQGMKTHHTWIFKKVQKPYTKIDACDTGVVLNKPLTDEQQAAIEKHLCQKGGKKCKVQVVAKTENISDLSVSYSKTGTEGDHVEPVKIGDVDRLPQFSKACSTGDYQDSWNDAASTSDSRSFLQGIGVNPDQVRDVGIDDKAGEFWEFGFVKQQQQQGVPLDLSPAPSQDAKDGVGSH